MSSLKDLASLIMIPSLYEDGELHTVKPLADENIIVHPDATDNNDGVDGSTPSTSSNFTFSRGSNLAATRVDVNGLIEKGRENLLLQSNQFDTTWTDSGANVSVTSGQSGYDNSTDAWLLDLDYTGGDAYLRQEKSISGVNTFSIYAKSGSADGIYIEFAAGNYPNIKVDLTDGSLISTNGTIDTNIESVGNGWYRVSFSVNQSLARVNIRIVNGSGTNTTGTIYIQDAQLEAGLVATDYIETGASTAQAGILEDMPRLDYSGSCPALLLEPQRTNALAYSEYLNGWNTIQAITIEANTDETLSPEGKYNAYKTIAIGGGTQRIYDVISVAAGSITMSMYVKAGTEDQIRLLTTALTFDITYDLTNETKIEEEGTGTIEAVGNGWYRISATGTSAGGTEVPQIRHLGTSGSSEYQYWYGVQIEEGSYPTSYIPTMGASVTRSQDIANLTDGVPNMIGANSFTFFYDCILTTPRNGSGTFAHLDLDGIIGIKGASNTTIRVHCIGSSNFSTSVPILDLSSGRHKFAITMNSNGVGHYFVDGVKQTGEITYSGNGFVGDDSKIDGGAYNQKSNQLVVFPTALTDSECIALTTL